MIEALPVRHEYSDEFRVYAPDPWKDKHTPEGLTSAMQVYDKGLCIGKHRVQNFYAIMWRRTISFRGWEAPDISYKPVVVWELRREWGDGKAYELGPWIIDKIIKSDTWRGFRDKADYARKKYKETTERLEAEERQMKARDDELAGDIFETGMAAYRAPRTIRIPGEWKEASQHECTPIVPGNARRRAVCTPQAGQ